jgi:hypothetical protein
MNETNSANLPLENWLFAAAIGGIATPLLLSGVLPQYGKTIALATGVTASAGLVAIEGAGRDWKKYRRAQVEINHLKIQDGFHAQEMQNQAAAEMSYKLALREWICANVPIEGWEYYFGVYEITAIALPQIHAARELMGLVPPPMLELEAEVIPQPQVNQESVVDTVARMVEESLDTEWFANWRRRSGIVCGESKDGKSFLLTNIVLAGYVKDHTDTETGKLNASVYICDPDYGSSHEGEEPNTWLDMPIGTVVSIKIKDIVNTIVAVSRQVDERADQTAEAVSKKLPKPVFDPVLLIVDEEPMVVSSLEDSDLKLVISALANILRRGIKQNITFKLGTQTLAVGAPGKGGTRLPMDLLRQVEMVLLWRAAQVEENYSNLGVRSEEVKEALTQIRPLPQRMKDKFVCVTYLSKELRIKGIPAVKAVKVAPPIVSQSNAAQSPDRPSPVTPNPDRKYETAEDLYKDMSDRLGDDFTDTELMSLYLELSEYKVKQEQWGAVVLLLREKIAGVRNAKK